MASVSMEIASNFMGLAKNRSHPISSAKTTHFFSRNRQNFTVQNRKFLACTISDNSRIVRSSKQPKRRLYRRLTAASSAAQTEDSGVVTKIPPDNRIPATIITGFLGSGKVFGVLWFSQFCVEHLNLSFSFLCELNEFWWGFVFVAILLSILWVDYDGNAPPLSWL